MKQLALKLEKKGWGGKREGAGRPPKKVQTGVPHRARPEHKARFPLHVTLRVARGVPSLRDRLPFWAIRRAVASAQRAEAFRIVAFSVQRDHIHLLVEASDTPSLLSATKSLVVRMALAINHILGRRGQVFAERYHARALTTPREVRNAYAYIMNNFRKHLTSAAPGADVFSSARWFDGWRTPPPPADEHERYLQGSDEAPPPTVAPKSWLAAIGWRRHGLLTFTDGPRCE